MAIYHHSTKAITRSSGRSATGAAAYRAGEKVVDERTGEVHNYRRKRGVLGKEIVMPDGASWKPTREQLWNAAEAAEKRKDSCVAREHEVAIPAELTPEQQHDLVRAYARNLANRHGCAVDFAIHAPGRGGDNRNVHAHILCTTRQVDGQGLGQKCVREQAGQKRKDGIELERKVWEDFGNRALKRAGHAPTLDRRTLKEQGVDRVPDSHLGPTVTAIKRKGRLPSYVMGRIATEKAVATVDKDIGNMRDQVEQVDKSIEQAKAEQQSRKEAERKAAAEQEKANRGTRWQRRTRGLQNTVWSADPKRGERKVYTWKEGPAAGKRVFVDHGYALVVAGSPTLPKVKAMVELAKQKWPEGVHIRGDDAFKALALPELLAQGVKVINPELQPAIQHWHAEQQRQAEAAKPKQDYKALMGKSGSAYMPKAEAPAQPAQQAKPTFWDQVRDAEARMDQKQAPDTSPSKQSQAAKPLAESKIPLTPEQKKIVADARLVREHERQTGFKLGRVERRNFLRDHYEQEAAKAAKAAEPPPPSAEKAAAKPAGKLKLHDDTPPRKPPRKGISR